MPIMKGLTLEDGFELARTTASASEKWRGNTWKTYFYCVRVWGQHGFKTFDQLSPESIGRFKRARLVGDKVAPGTVNSDLAALQSILVELEEHGEDCEHLVRLLRSNRIHVKKRRKHRAYFLTRKEVLHLCAAAKAVEPRAEFALLVAVWSGVRVSELARMRREDFTLGPRPILRVEEVPELGDDGFAKTGARVVPVCAELKDLILMHAPPQGYVFQPGGTKNPRGIKSHRLFRSTDCMERDIARVRAEAGLPKVTWNTLRHTRASWWAQAGVPKAKICEWLGNSEGVLEDFYIGFAEDYDADCEKAPPLEPLVSPSLTENRPAV